MSEEQLIERLVATSTATITTLLFKMGIRNTWIRSAAPLFANQQRRAGPAFTLRFIPMREDIATPELWSAPTSTRAAVEEMPPGCFAVADAMGQTSAGIFGDILCARMKVRGVAGLVTDGALRDAKSIGDLDLPVWSRGSSAPPATAALTFVDWQRPVACGGVAIFPGDYLVGDGDGVVVIPARLVQEIASAGAEEEELDEWIRAEVLAGVPLPDVYPPDAAAIDRYNKFRNGKLNRV